MASKITLDGSKIVSRRVLVFGATGTGKTSFLNGITEKHNATSNNAIGCTFQSTEYSPVQLPDGNYYTFIDTVGLNEGTHGKMDGKRAVKELFKLISNNKEGFSLLIMVIKATRIDASMEKNYKLFVNELVDGKIPVILVITQCEFGTKGGLTLNLDEWLDHNKESLYKYGFYFKGIVSTCWASSEVGEFENIYKNFRETSKKKAIDSIVNNSLAENMSFIKGGIIETIRKMWNYVANIYKLPIWMGKLTELLMSLGFEKSEAVAMESSI